MTSCLLIEIIRFFRQNFKSKFQLPTKKKKKIQISTTQKILNDLLKFLKSHSLCIRWQFLENLKFLDIWILVILIKKHDLNTCFFYYDGSKIIYIHDTCWLYRWDFIFKRGKIHSLSLVSTCNYDVNYWWSGDTTINRILWQYSDLVLWTMDTHPLMEYMQVDTVFFSKQVDTWNQSHIRSSISTKISFGPINIHPF